MNMVSINIRAFVKDYMLISRYLLAACNDIGPSSLILDLSLSNPPLTSMGMHLRWKGLTDIGANDVAVSALKTLGVERPSKIQVVAFQDVQDVSCLLYCLVEI